MKKFLAMIIAFFKKLFGKAPIPASTLPASTGTGNPPTPPQPVPVPVLPAGVKLTDLTNGLVQIADADAIAPGQLYCAAPVLPLLKAGTQAYATVLQNTADAKAADEGLGLWGRVAKLVPAKNPDGTDGWGNSKSVTWLDNAWTVGAEFDTWDKVIAQAKVIATRLANANPGTGGSGFSPHK